MNNHFRCWTRRQFLQKGGSTALLLGSISDLYSVENTPNKGSNIPAEQNRINSSRRTWNLSTSFRFIQEYPELIDEWSNAGITDIWPTLYHPGQFLLPFPEVRLQKQLLEQKGFRVHWLGLPLGHPKWVIRKNGQIVHAGNQSGLPSGNGKFATHFHGKENWGVSLHRPMDLENVKAVRQIESELGPCDYFLDDDFRLEANPYSLGGCVCDECRREFLQHSGLSETRWPDLLHDLRQNNDTSLLRNWVDYLCDKLTGCFRMMQKAAPSVDIGIMVMFFGMERAGIRLDDYRDSLFRVGEMMFGDSMFDKLKNKMDELFSVLLHRRFAAPGRAFSETTMYPAKTLSLSKENMAAKLTISTVADVRNTMFMTGDAPIPAEYWRYFKSRIIHETAIHEQISGAKLRGPFKHYWGRAGRYLGTKGPFSLFLASGVPFEVCDEIPKEGWTFLGDEDASAMDRGDLLSSGSRCFARIPSTSKRFQTLDEKMDDLFQFRRSLTGFLRERHIPYVEEETPIVLAWYPDRKKAVLWNVEKTDKTIHILLDDKRIPLTVGPLQSILTDL